MRLQWARHLLIKASRDDAPNGEYCRRVNNDTLPYADVPFNNRRRRKCSPIRCRNLFLLKIRRPGILPSCAQQTSPMAVYFCRISKTLMIAGAATHVIWHYDTPDSRGMRRDFRR